MIGNAPRDVKSNNTDFVRHWNTFCQLEIPLRPRTACVAVLGRLLLSVRIMVPTEREAPVLPFADTLRSEKM